MEDLPRRQHLVSPDHEQGTRDLGADDLRDRRGDQEIRQGSRAIPGGEPVCQIHDHAWKEARFRQAKEEPDRIEVPWHLDGCGQRRHHAPRHHDPRQPLARAPALDDEGAGNLEKEIADEEDARPEADHRVVESRQVLRHGQLRDRDVRAVDVGDDVADETERQQSPVRFAAGAIERRHRRRLHQVARVTWVDSQGRGGGDRGGRR